jgi:hypothetical protein
MSPVLPDLTKLTDLNKLFVKSWLAPKKLASFVQLGSQLASKKRLASFLQEKRVNGAVDIAFMGFQVWQNKTCFN